MDIEPPTRHPCICDELHRTTELGYPKRIGMPLFGSFTTLPPIEGIATYVWDSCPRHGGYLVADGYASMSKQINRKLLPDRPKDLINRSWMYKEKSGYAYGTEPPWEPTYCEPRNDGMHTVKYYPFEQRWQQSARRITQHRDAPSAV